jgi:hypothetical protein
MYRMYRLQVGRRRNQKRYMNAGGWLGLRWTKPTPQISTPHNMLVIRRIWAIIRFGIACSPNSSHDGARRTSQLVPRATSSHEFYRAA